MPETDGLSDEERNIHDGEICLAGPAAVDIFTQCIDDFKNMTFEERLRGMRIVKYQFANGHHVLHKYPSEDLITTVEREHSARGCDATEFSIERYPFIHDPRKEPPPYTNGSVWVGPKTKSLSGRLSLCICGEDGCGVDLAIITLVATSRY